MEDIKNKKISIILSTFNEEIAIEKTINEIQNQKIKIFSRKKNKGLASAFLLGLINTEGDIIGWVDSNMASIVKIFPEMIQNLENNDIVLLSRFIDGGKDERNVVRRWSSYILNKFTDNY